MRFIFTMAMASPRFLMKRRITVFLVWGLQLCFGRGMPWQESPLLDVGVRMERILLANIMPFWSHVIDANGGYVLNHDANGTLIGPSTKHLVTQARMVWFFSKLYNSKRYSKRQYLHASTHGFHFLRMHMWDSKYGGFFWEVDGGPGHRALKTDKSLYGQAFALFALAEYIQASGDPDAWALAGRLSSLLHRHARDALFGGYFEQLPRDWSQPTHSHLAPPSPAADAQDAPWRSRPRGQVGQHAGREDIPLSYLGIPAHMKTMNTHLHLMEAYTKYHALCARQQRAHVAPALAPAPAGLDVLAHAGINVMAHTQGNVQSQGHAGATLDASTMNGRAATARPCPRDVAGTVAGTWTWQRGPRGSNASLQAAGAAPPGCEGHARGECPGHAVDKGVLAELFLIMGDGVVRHKWGACSDMHARDWAPLMTSRAHGRLPPGARVSYGHDLENVWMLVDAALAMGVASLGPLLPLLRRLFDYSLAHGADKEDGGVFESGPLGGDADMRGKVWWVQAEAMVAALYMYRLTAEQQYLDFLLKTLSWVETCQVDWDHGEWHARLDLADRDSAANNATGGTANNATGGTANNATGGAREWRPARDLAKADGWKSAYHNGRAMLKCLQLLDTWPGLERGE
eukprot:jgi/Mesvir1/13223/Mv25859-RA.2